MEIDSVDEAVNRDGCRLESNTPSICENRESGCRESATIEIHPLLSGVVGGVEL